jgi:hypothetical protein
VTPPSSPPSTPHRPLIDSPRSKKEKKAKKAKKAKKEKTTVAGPPPPAAGGVIGVDEFWTDYPRKRGKEAARKAWTKLKPDAALMETIRAALAIQAVSSEWRRDNGRFIPHPATWLNAKRWTDQLSSNGTGTGHTSRADEIRASGERAKALIRQTQGAMA